MGVCSCEKMSSRRNESRDNFRKDEMLSNIGESYEQED